MIRRKQRSVGAHNCTHAAVTRKQAYGRLVGIACADWACTSRCLQMMQGRRPAVHAVWYRQLKQAPNEFDGWLQHRHTNAERHNFGNARVAVLMQNCQQAGHSAWQHFLLPCNRDPLVARRMGCEQTTLHGIRVTRSMQGTIWRVLPDSCTCEEPRDDVCTVWNLRSEQAAIRQMQRLCLLLASLVQNL